MIQSYIVLRSQESTFIQRQTSAKADKTSLHNRLKQGKKEVQIFLVRSLDFVFIMRQVFLRIHN
jgi:hypothetical protein